MALGNEELLVRIRGIDGLSAPAQKAEQSLRELGNQARRSQVQMNQFGGSFTGVAKDMRKWSLGALQQAGYQVGDFAVQVANGTSRMQAFGQQAPQLLQIFGPLGAAAGAAVAIFAAYSVAAEKASKSTSNLQAAMKSLGDMASTYQDKFDMLRFGVDTAAEATAFAELTRLTKEYNDLREEYRNTDSLGRRQAIAEEANQIKSQIAGQKNILNELEAKRKSYEDALLINNQMLSVELAHARIAGQLAQYAKDSNAAYRQYYQSRIAAAQMADREERRLLIAYHGEQLRVMGETQATALRDVANLKKAYAEYYASRIMGEQMAYPKSTLKGGRSAGIGGPTHEELVRNDPRVQLAYSQMEIEDAAYKKALGNAKALKNVVSQQLSPELKRAADLGQSVGQSFENAMMSAVKGTMSVRDAFRAMAVDIISELYRVFVVKRITGFITDAVSMAALPTNKPNTGTLGLPSFAGGGYTGSGSRSGGMDGNGGFMAMLHPNESVIDHTKGGSGQIVVNQTINVSTGVQQTVRNEIKSLMPQIAESAKAAVADAKRRGGSYGRAFA